MKGVETVMDMRAAVIDSALEHGCPEDKVILVWDAIAPMEAPQSQKHLDNDVLYVMKTLGL